MRPVAATFFLAMVFGACATSDDATQDHPQGTDAGHPAVDACAEESSGPRVRIVYLVPSDLTPDEEHIRVLRRAIEHLQSFYRSELGGAATLRLHNPVVEVITTTHPAAWYATHETGNETFRWWWLNTVADGLTLTGGAFNDPDNIWIFYNLSDPTCGQLQGAATDHVAALPANDLRGLAHQWPLLKICETDPDDWYEFPPCRWVGGLGHELGHALGLPHPPGCDSAASTCDADALMWQGVYSYPDTYLRDDNRDALQGLPFFSPREPTSAFDCNAL